MTIPEYLDNLNRRYKTGITTEHSFRGDLQQLVESIAKGVMATNEPTRIACGSPDFFVIRLPVIANCCHLDSTAGTVTVNAEMEDTLCGSTAISLTASVNIALPNPASVADSFIANPYTVALGDSTTLTVGGLTQVSIYDTSGWVLADTGLTTTVAPLDTTTYAAVGLNVNGCADTLYLTVIVLAPLPNSCSFYQILDVQGPVTSARSYFHTLRQDTTWGVFVDSINGGYRLDSLPTTITFHGVLYVDCYLGFRNCANIVFSPGAQIRDTTGIKGLEIHGCHLYACQDTMWEGIFLMHSGQDTIADYVTAFDTIHSVIEDAHYATEVSNQNVTLIDNNTRYKNNLMGVLFINGAYSSSKINGCLFESDSINSHSGLWMLPSLPFPYGSSLTTDGKHGWIGLSMNNVSALNIGSSSSGLIDNKFLRLNVGIYGMTSRFNSYANFFHQIKSYDSTAFDIGWFGMKTGSGANLFYCTNALISGLGATDSVTFDDCRYGVYSTRSYGRVNDNNMKLDYKGDEYGVYEKFNSYQNFDIIKNRIDGKKGCVFLGSNIESRLTVKDNLFNVNMMVTSGASLGYFGVEEAEAGMHNFTIIENNTVNVWRASHGIWLNNTTNTSANCNIINLLSTGNNVNRYGIYAIGSKNFILNDSISGNPIKKTKIGIYGTGLNTNAVYGNMTDVLRIGMDFNGTNNGTTIKYNKMYGNSYGMYFWHPVFGGSTTQGTSTYGYGNLWLTPASVYDAYSNATGIQQIIFNIGVPSASYFTPSSVGGTGFHIFPIVAGGNLGYINNCASNPWGNIPNIIPDDTTGFDGEQGEYDTNFPGYSYSRELYNYRLWQLDSTLRANHQDLVSYYDSLQGTDFGQVAGLEELITADSANFRYWIEQLDANNSLYSSANEHYEYYDSIIESGNYSMADKDSLNWWTTWLKAYQTNDRSIRHEIDSLRKAKASDLLSLNGAIVTSKAYLENELMVNDIYLNTAYVATDSFTTDEYDLLLYIALQCPETGGPAVFRARSLIALTDPTAFFDDDSLCASNERKANMQQPINETDFTTYPNPTDSKIYFEWSRELNNGVIEIYNEFGQLMFEEKLAKDELQTTVDFNELPAGLYLYKIKENEQLISAGKIAVVK